MDVDLPDPLVRCGVDEREYVVFVTVDAARGKQTEDVNAPVPGLSVVDAPHQGRGTRSASFDGTQ